MVSLLNIQVESFLSSQQYFILIPGIIISKLDDVFRLLPPSSWFHRIKPELSLTAKLVFYYFTIFSRNRSTLGQHLLGFRYKVG